MVLGSNSDTERPLEMVKSSFFGQLKLTAIHTPGHTDESTSYVLTDISAGEQPTLVFTGDTLFVGDVGRIDLYGLEEAPRLAENLYDSIFKKLLPLGDGVMVYPAHGAGSVCGGAIGEREVSTLGLERLQNFALRKTRKDDFIRFKVSEHHERPPYFSKMEEYNLQGPRLLDRLPDPRPLLPREFKEQIELGAKVIDTREPPAFSASHIKDSYNIWLEGLPIFAGWVLTYDKPLLLIFEDWIHLEKAVRYLIRLGYDRTVGYLRGGMEAWYREALPFEKIDLLSVEELKKRLERGDDLVILDVRGKDEWEDGHIEGAIHIYIGQLVGRLNEVPKDKPVAVVCMVGNRASLGASILRQDGRRDVLTVLGSMAAWENAGYPIVK